MFGFRGLGYSPAFVENMQAVVDSFFARGSRRTELLAGPDDICAACPHLRDAACTGVAGGEAAVRQRDEAVLNTLGLAPGDRLGSSDLTRLIPERITADSLATLCVGCQWLDLGYCQQGLASPPGVR